MLKRQGDGFRKPWQDVLIICLTVVVFVTVMLLLFAVFLWFLPDEPSYPIQVGAAVAAPLT